MASSSKLSRTSSGSQLSSTTDGEQSLASSSELPSARRKVRRELQHHLNSGTPQNILLFLIAFRILNAFCVRTFFQPDEFFQSLEPAWQMVFGEDSGAWITWEWRHHLRSSIHPSLFAAVYYLADLAAKLFGLSPSTRADLLIASPKLVQAVFAALGDYYTWKLAGRVYGHCSNEAWGALALTVLSPWQWFCSTRTLSNCLETTLTIVALYQWPWEWSSDPSDDVTSGADSNKRQKYLDEVSSFTLLRNSLSGGSIFLPLVLLREAAMCGSAVLIFSILTDRLYYGIWTFPPLKFLYFNIAQSLAVFYGTNDWHYYLSQGLPLLLTTALPFSLVGLYHALIPPRSQTSTALNLPIKRQLALICLFTSTTLSIISHKEVRFIYPLLPALHILTSAPLVEFFLPAITSSSTTQIPRRLSLLFLILANIFIALYTTLSHASGPLNILEYIRDQHTSSSLSSSNNNNQQPITTAGFLMPCHSTPWRSHLVHPDIHAWALSCEPPVDQNATAKATYLDEADQFYADTENFLRTHMVGGLSNLPRQPSQHPIPSPQGQQQATTHPWPNNLIFFSPLEPILKSLLRSSSYAECYRSWNTAWHDDARRKGDIIVWCLDEGVQHEWRERQKREREVAREREFDRWVEGIRRGASTGGSTGWMGRLKVGWKGWKWPGKKVARSRFWEPREWVDAFWERVEGVRRRFARSERSLWS
ncbi:glycosylphosphatidylinositol anchor biosynthesis [Arachnomyces sp. PD_36]|nr:glycosylphosphatidylinositol anchor biosynthesis [Arachnomyces sp. PD_36]